MCTGVVVYEDVPERNQVFRLYDRLADQFNHDLEFAFEWWRCKYLTDPDMAREAAEAASKADLILFSFHRLAEVPLEAKAWIERWLLKREPSAGALVVVQSSAEVPGTASSQDSYLCQVAKRAHLDYLPLPGPEPTTDTRDTRREPDPGTFDQSASRQFHSSGYGIDE